MNLSVSIEDNSDQVKFVKKVILLFWFRKFGNRTKNWRKNGNWRKNDGNSEMLPPCTPPSTYFLQNVPICTYFYLYLLLLVPTFTGVPTFTCTYFLQNVPICAFLYLCLLFLKCAYLYLLLLMYLLFLKCTYLHLLLLVPTLPHLPQGGVE